MSVLIQIIGPKKKKHNFHLQNWRTPSRLQRCRETIETIVLKVVNLRYVVAGFPDGDGSAQIQPGGRLVCRTKTILLRLARTNAGERVVRTHQFGIETNLPSRQRFGPNAEDPGVFANESFAGVEFDRSWSCECE